MSNYNNSNSNLNNNNANLNDLKYEFIKLKRNELHSLVKTNIPSFDANYRKLTLNSDSFFANLYLLLTGYSASLVLVNFITDNVLYVYTNLFVLVLLLFNNNLISLVFKLFTVFLLFLVKLLFVLSSKNKCNDKLNNTLFFVSIVALNLLFLLNFIANRYNLNNWDVSNRNRNRVSKVVKLFNTSELYSCMVGNLVFLSVFYFVVKLYTISYILIIIVIFLLLSRYRLSDLYNYKNAKVKNRRSFGRLSTNNKWNGVHYFPVVQNLITTFLLTIVLLIIVLNLAPNNILYVNNYPYINKYITLNNYAKVKFLNKVKFLIVYTFFVLLLLLVLVVMYLLYFFGKFNPFLNEVLYNNYYLFTTVGSYDYNGAVRRLFLKDTSKNTDGYVDTLRDSNSQEVYNKFDRKLKVYLYYVDVHDKLVKVKPLCSKFTKTKNFDNSDYVNKKINKMYSKLMDKKNKLVNENEKNMNEKYFIKKLSTKLSNKFSSLTSKELGTKENNLLPFYEKHNSSVGCSYHYTNTFNNSYMEDFNNLVNNYNNDSGKPHAGELFYYLQRYVLLNKNEPSQFCLLAFHSSKKKVRNTNNYFNQNYLGLKFKLLQYMFEFNCFMFLFNKNLENQELPPDVTETGEQKLTERIEKQQEKLKFQLELLEQQNNNQEQSCSSKETQNNIKQKLMQQEKEEQQNKTDNEEKQQQKLLTGRNENNNKEEKQETKGNDVCRLSIPSEYLNDTARSSATYKTDNNFLNSDYLSQRQRETQINLEVQQLYSSSNNNKLLEQQKLLTGRNENNNKEEENFNEYNNIVENFNENLLKEKHFFFDEEKKLTERIEKQQKKLKFQLELLEQQNREKNNRGENDNNLYNKTVAVDKSAALNVENNEKVNAADNKEQQENEELFMKNNAAENKEDSDNKENKGTTKTDKSNNKERKKKPKYLNKLFNLRRTTSDDFKKNLGEDEGEKVEMEGGNSNDNEDMEEEQNTYEHEYVVNTDNSYTKLFSNSYNTQESSQFENNKIKKLTLNTNYINNYSYNMNFNQLLNKNVRPNTINKYDSSGTNLLIVPHSLTETKVRVEREDNDSKLTLKREDRFEGLEEYLGETEEENNNKEVDEKVDSIMKDLMKDLNLEF